MHWSRSLPTAMLSSALVVQTAVAVILRRRRGGGCGTSNKSVRDAVRQAGWEMDVPMTVSSLLTVRDKGKRTAIGRRVVIRVGGIAVGAVGVAAAAEQHWGYASMAVTASTTMWTRCWGLKYNIREENVIGVHGELEICAGRVNDFVVLARCFPRRLLLLHVDRGCC